MSSDQYKPTIGLEIHCELNTGSKMFCSCPNGNGEVKPNTNVCPVCMGHPGTLPVANQKAVKLVMKTGLAIGSEILKECKFDRKNYFYPDLPKGYQISQYDLPFCLGGKIEIEDGTGAAKTIRVTRVHLEEDTAKLLHPDGEDHSLVDFNRSGVPLMELVTEPDIASAVEARRFAEELQLILRYLGVSDADMDKGKMRVEVNISLSIVGQDDGKLGTKVEIKNLNSLRAVEGSVAYEIERQRKVLEGGAKIIQETRGWNEAKLETFSQREKEEAFDYRYFPEPDLAPYRVSDEEIRKIRSEIGELPAAKRSRFASEFSLDGKTVDIYVKNRDLGSYFEKTISELANWVKEQDMKEDVLAEEFVKLCKLTSNYLVTDVLGLLKNQNFSQDQFKASAENFAEFIKMIYKGEISSKIAKIVLQVMMETGADPSNIIADKGLAQISDCGEIEALVAEVIKKNPKAAEDFKNGKGNAFQFLVGQILSESRGKANPQMVREILKKKLDTI